MNKNCAGQKITKRILIKSADCISAAPTALDRYLTALPAMSLIPVAPLRSPAGSSFQKVAGFFDLGREAFLIGQRELVFARQNLIR
jgi:hypothetical protein